ncbi:hypothetical protein Mext_4856 [Methylorubrum extorquens PA1]|nr:hypothetical protein Mext_4856 [Methylorubrum extorquens PA1]
MHGALHPQFDWVAPGGADLRVHRTDAAKKGQGPTATGRLIHPLRRFIELGKRGRGAPAPFVHLLRTGVQAARSGHARSRTFALCQKVDARPR